MRRWMTPRSARAWLQMTLIEAIRAGHGRRAGPRRPRSSSPAKTSASAAASSAPRRACSTSTAPTRVIDSPLAELSIVGVGIGAALYGPAAHLRDPVRRLHPPGLQPDRQRGRQDVLPLQRRVAACPMVIRAPYGGGISGGAVPLAVGRGLLRARARPEGGHPLQPARRQGPAQVGRARPQPGDVLRAQEGLPPHQGRGARRRLHRAHRPQPASSRAGPRPVGVCLRHDALLLPAGRREAGRRGRGGGGGGPAHALPGGPRRHPGARCARPARRWWSTRTT